MQWFWSPRKIKSVTVSTFSPSICHEVMGPDARIFVFWMWILSQLFNDNNKNFKFHSWAGFPITPAGGSILILFSFPSNLFYDFHPLLWPLAGWRGKKGRKCLYNLEFRDALASALPMKQVVSSLRYFCGFFKDLLVSGESLPSHSTPSWASRCLMEPQNCGLPRIGQPSHLGYKLTPGQLSHLNGWA